MPYSHGDILVHLTFSDIFLLTKPKRGCRIFPFITNLLYIAIYFLYLFHVSWTTIYFASIVTSDKLVLCNKMYSKLLVLLQFINLTKAGWN